MGVFKELQQRGLIAQMTHPEETKRLLESEKTVFYIGFDPTGDSLHVGHFLQMIIMKHMQDAGHLPIALVGGGTAMVPDPTGKDDMRKILTVEEIRHNADCLKEQMSKFIDFSDGKAIMVNNADWLLELNYINFLREVGMHFSVNRMLSAECFKSRLERGLSFIEFNYMLMQGYDFYVLNKEHDCKMQLGGDDQWSNIIGGVELIRRKTGREAYGMTFCLLTNSEGKKMGKTEKGAIWIDAEKTPPYDFYQYWRNVDDADVVRCLKMLTFIPLSEIAQYESLEGSGLNPVKELLAYELTKTVHGAGEADKARQTALALFGQGANSENMPSTEIERARIEAGASLAEIMVEAGLAPSKGEARRLIQQGGVSVNDIKIDDMNMTLGLSHFDGGSAVIKKGKKVYHRIVI